MRRILLVNGTELIVLILLACIPLHPLLVGNSFALGLLTLLVQGTTAERVVRHAVGDAADRSIVSTAKLTAVAGGPKARLPSSKANRHIQVLISRAYRNPCGAARLG